MKNYLTEGLGTFFLVLVIGLTVASGSILAPLAIGSVLMIMVYAGGHISGGHYNPAVTLGIILSGNMSYQEGLRYMASQIIGAFVAAGVSYALIGSALVVAPTANAVPAIIAEVVFTFALVYTVLMTAVSKSVSGNSYYGLAIGFIVMVGALSVGSISGGAFNPAVALGPQLFDLIIGGTSITSIWIYLIACFGGGTLAALRYNMIQK